MKVGIVISVIIVIFFGGMIFVATLGFPDAPNPRICNDQMMKKQRLPDDLPFIAEPGGSGDSGPIYDQAIELYKSHPGAFRDDEPPPPEMGDQMAKLLIEAMTTGDVQAPFLDKYSQMMPGARPEYGDALAMISQSMVQHATGLWKGGHKDDAIRIMRAVWAFGRRAFEHCVRLENRRFGLGLMIIAGTELFNWSEHIPDLAAQIDPWAIVGGDANKSPINIVQDNWNPKVEVVLPTRPAVGDLLYIAEHDEDLSFRVEAVLRMGVVKFNPRSRGNARAVAKAIAHYKRSGDPLIAQAAEAADKFTLEDMRSIN